MRHIRKEIYFCSIEFAFHELNSDFIATFDLFLKTEAGLCRNTIVRYMKCFNPLAGIVRLAYHLRRMGFGDGHQRDVLRNGGLNLL